MTIPMPQMTSARLEGLAVFFGRAIIWLLALAFVTPYFAAFAGVQLGDSDRALISQIVSALINVLMILAGFLFGTSLNKQRQDEQQQDTINKQAAATATLAAAAGPTPAPLQPTASAVAAASGGNGNGNGAGSGASSVTFIVKPDNVTQAAWDAMNDAEKLSAVTAPATPPND